MPEHPTGPVGYRSEPTKIHIRPATTADIRACGQVVFDAYKAIDERHGFPPYFPCKEQTHRVTRSLVNHARVFGTVAEHETRVIGCGFIHEYNPIPGIGPLSVAPDFQGLGIGKALLQHLLERAEHAPGVRLTQDAFNTASMGLYAASGFEIKEPLVLVSGSPKSRPSPRIHVRYLEKQDLDACAGLCSAVHGFHRTAELKGAFVALRDGRITAYATEISPSGHAVAETDEDLQALILTAAVPPLSFLVPTRRAAFLRWCLNENLRMTKPLNLMARGQYRDPEGAYMPSLLY